MTAGNNTKRLLMTAVVLILLLLVAAALWMRMSDHHHFGNERFESAGVIIDHPYSFEGHGAVQGVYFGQLKTIESEDKLVGATTPIAERVEIHHMAMQDSVMRMREVAQVAITTDGSANFKKGATDGYHLMLFKPSAQIKVGDSFPLTLVFENAGPISIKVLMESMEGHEGHDHGEHKH